MKKLLNPNNIKKAVRVLLLAAFSITATSSNVFTDDIRPNDHTCNDIVLEAQTRQKISPEATPRLITKLTDSEDNPAITKSLTPPPRRISMYSFFNCVNCAKELLRDVVIKRFNRDFCGLLFGLVAAHTTHEFSETDQALMFFFLSSLTRQSATLVKKSTKNIGLRSLRYLKHIGLKCIGLRPSRAREGDYGEIEIPISPTLKKLITKSLTNPPKQFNTRYLLNYAYKLQKKIKMKRLIQRFSDSLFGLVTTQFSRIDKDLISLLLNLLVKKSAECIGLR